MVFSQIVGQCIKLWDRFLKGRFKSLLRVTILFACSIMVVIQLSECFAKLISPPISSNTRVILNKTMTYPAVTICRSPPYKPQVVQDHNLGDDIRWTSEWVNFPFENVSLQKFWDTATYSQREVFSLYALNSRREYVNITNSTFFLSGQCHTLHPQTETAGAGRDVGYSVWLRHSLAEINDPPLVHELGWNVFIHDAREPWTESRLQTSGRQEGLFLDVAEQLHVKIGVQDFKMINDKCNPDPSYSITQCEDLCHWRHLVATVGCGAPWLMGVNATHCNSYQTMKSLIVGYLHTECPGTCCSCATPCRARQYTSFIVNRKPLTDNFSQLYVFYSSKLVTLTEEQVSYDWSLFIADMGGSLGFLLGISVLGIIDIVDRVINAYLCRGERSHSNVVAIPQKF